MKHKKRSNLFILAIFIMACLGGWSMTMASAEKRGAQEQSLAGPANKKNSMVVAQKKAQPKPAAVPQKNATAKPAAAPQNNARVNPAAAPHARWHQSNLERHWEKHGSEFPEYHSAQEYGDAALKFFQNPPQGTLTKVRPDGEKLFYHPASNTFGVTAPDGTPKTLFRPSGRTNYWNRQ